MTLIYRMKKTAINKINHEILKFLISRVAFVELPNVLLNMILFTGGPSVYQRTYALSGALYFF